MNADSREGSRAAPSVIAIRMSTSSPAVTMSKQLGHLHRPSLNACIVHPQASSSPPGATMNKPLGHPHLQSLNACSCHREAQYVLRGATMNTRPGHRHLPSPILLSELVHRSVWSTPLLVKEPTVVSSCW